MRTIHQLPPNLIDRKIKRIKRLMKSCKDSRLQERLQAVFLYLQGYVIKEIASIIGRGIPTTYRYINAYNEGGLKALRMKHSPGRPSLLTEEQRQQVYHVVAHSVPKDVGFSVEMNWTAPLLQEWIKKTFGISYSIRGTLWLLHSLGFSCTRPTYTLAKADPHKQEAFLKNWIS